MSSMEAIDTPGISSKKSLRSLHRTVRPLAKRIYSSPRGLLFRRSTCSTKNQNEEKNMYAIFSSQLFHKNVDNSLPQVWLHDNTATTRRLFVLDLLLDLPSHRLLINLGTGC